MSLKGCTPCSQTTPCESASDHRSVSFEEAKAPSWTNAQRAYGLPPSNGTCYSLKPISAKTLDGVPKTATDPHQIATLKVFFNWCIDRDMTDHNPYARRKVVTRQRDRVLTDDEIARLMAYDNPPTRPSSNSSV